MADVFVVEPPPVMWAIIAILIVIIVLLALVLASPVFIAVAPDHISITGLPLCHMVVNRSDVESVQLISLNGSTYSPKLRLLGTSIPGWHVGWFKLADGSKAFLVAAREDKAVLLRKRGGEYIILAPRDIEHLADSLKRHGWLEGGVPPG